MDVKFKIGDRIRRQEGVNLSGQEGVITHIAQRSSVGHILTIRRTNDKTVIWYGTFCDLIKDSDLVSLCNCNIDILMAKGCQCKGN